LNASPDHLSHIETREEPTNFEEFLHDMQHFMVRITDNHFADIIHFLTTGIAPEWYTNEKKRELVVHAAYFCVITRHLYKTRLDEILRSYVPDFECNNILIEAHG